MQALLIDIEGWEIQMERLLKQIEAYKPCNEQEEKDRELLLQWIRSGMDIVTRANETAHLTASAWVVSPDRKQVLMAYHNIYHSWAWLGGHADGDADLCSVAVREVKEESGIEEVKLLSDQPFSLEILSVDGHVKRGKYVTAHLHLNVTYLMEASESGNPGSGGRKRAFTGHTTTGGTGFTGDSDCGWSLEAWNVCALSSSSERYLSYGSRSQETNT